MHYKATNSKQAKALTDSVLSSPLFVFVYLDGCPWCERMRPEWNRLIKKNQDSLSFLEINRLVLDEISVRKVQQAMKNVTTVPSLQLLHPTKRRREYKGTRTAEEMTAFLQRYAL